MQTGVVHPDTGLPLQVVPRATQPLCRVYDLAAIELEGPDLPAARRFFTAFGLTLADEQQDCLCFSAQGGAPVALVYRRGRRSRFVGPTFAVRERTELDVLAARLPGTCVEPLPLPGNPPGVIVSDPNGLRVTVAWFEDWRELPLCESPPATNRGARRERVNQPLRPEPSLVLRLGHLVLGTPAWEATARV